MSDALLRDGRYQVFGKLGEGSQGTTFDAVDRREGKPVAIKRFAVRGARSWKDVELAEREATVLETLSHPLLPAHVEHFEEDGALYLVMEKIEGQSLAALAERGGALSRQDVLAFLRDASGVLEYLHGRSPPIIHRDVNPRNVVRRPDGTFVLVDFGAVRARLEPAGGSTVVGTFGYMAPEQFQGRALPQSDVYAVGATALRLLTGLEPDKLPHKGLGIDVAAALPGFEPALREVLQSMLEPDPDRRARSITPLLERLERESNGARSAPRPRGDGERQEPREPRTRSGARGRQRYPGWTFDDESWSWRAEQRAAWEQARADREQWREWKKRVREARRARRHGSHPVRRGRPLWGPPLLVAVLAITMAMWVVGVVVGVFVPALLLVLSILFGPSLRDAARSTRLAARSARDSMAHFRSYLLYGVQEAPGEASRAAESEPRRVRVEAEAEPAAGRRARVAHDEEVVETTGTDVTDRAEH